MTKQALIGMFLLSEVAIYAQDRVITGRISESNGKPLIGASICQSNTKNCSYTDRHGLFHLLIDDLRSPQLNIRHVGYEPLTISNLDTISDLLEVELTVDTIPDTYIHPENHVPYEERKLKYGFISFLQVDFILNDFGDFRPLLGDHNVDLMNESSGIFSMEVAGTYKRYYAGLNFGLADDVDHTHDSLDIEFRTRQYGSHFGYILVNSRRLMFTPKVALKWNWYRLLNNDKEKNIPIEQYVSERDLDLRFNQITGFVGFSLSYKMHKFNLLGSDYWTWGVYGGYAFKLHDDPWIHSRGNRLTSSGTIEIENYNFGIHFSFNFDGR